MCTPTEATLTLTTTTWYSPMHVNCSQTQHDPAAARAARLAALEARGAAGGGAQQESAEPLLGASDESVLTLQDMGFSANEAREALRHTNGDVEAAVSHLSG